MVLYKDLHARRNPVKAARRRCIPVWACTTLIGPERIGNLRYYRESAPSENGPDILNMHSNGSISADERLERTQRFATLGEFEIGLEIFGTTGKVHLPKTARIF